MKSFRIISPCALLILCGLVDWSHSHPLHTPSFELEGDAVKSSAQNVQGDDKISVAESVIADANSGHKADPSSNMLKSVDPERNQNAVKAGDDFKSLSGDDARGSRTNKASEPKTQTEGERKTFLKKIRSLFLDGPVKLWRKIKQWFSKANFFKSNDKKSKNPGTDSPSTFTKILDRPSETPLTRFLNQFKKPEDVATSTEPTQWWSDEKIHKTMERENTDILHAIEWRILALHSPPGINNHATYDEEEKFLKSLKSTVTDEGSQYHSLLMLVGRALETGKKPKYRESGELESTLDLTDEDKRLLIEGKIIIESALQTLSTISITSESAVANMGKSATDYRLIPLVSWNYLKGAFTKNSEDRISFNDWLSLLNKRLNL
ncbi:hypothetical protein DFH28DRAFT_1018438 [Melampsora americana]|nr:hypothetical protein DFH28DRAFT_1018438 [Melampsora americana]